MKVGVLGTGEVGRTLASGFVGEGHQVMLGSRDPGQEKVVAWEQEAGPNACAGT
ncbi:MAG TPA: NAD(P)-binding domain-containing protein, partial [Armatimonadota bacterium]